MTKTIKPITQQIAKNLDVSTALVRRVLDMFIDEIASSVQSWDKVQIKNLGIFFPVTREPQTFLSWLSGKDITTKKSTRIKFKCSEKLVIKH